MDNKLEALTIKLREIYQSAEIQWPLIRSALTIFISYPLMLVAHKLITGAEILMPLSWQALVYWPMGVAFTHGVEYLWHHYILHKKVNMTLYKGHLQHHKVFNTKNFRSKNPDDFKDIVSDWYIFPSLLATFYTLFLVVFYLFLDLKHLPIFFLGVVMHYALYEWCHWFTHVEDNWMDRFIKNPGSEWLRTTSPWQWLIELREKQIEHHRLHHEEVKVNYNFNPPYLGDKFQNTFKIFDGKK